MVMKSAKVSELKARLSFYLAAVRRGETVVVYDRSTPVARVVPYELKADDLTVDGPRKRPRALKAVRGIHPRGAVDVVELLRDSRDQR
jgi:prevent-host-death family protein